jgi:hypothetical protein
MSDKDKVATPAGAPAKTESTQEKSARLKALRLQEKEAVAARVARASRKARARRTILG